MSKYLVTGGMGFIGSLVVDRLTRSGHDVRVFDNLSSGPGWPNRDAELVRGDIRDGERVAQAASGMDGVVHLAARSSAAIPPLQWLDHHGCNLGGAVSVFAAALNARNGPLPVVYASSAAVYGAASIGAESEGGAVRPTSPYGADKLGCELHARTAASVYGLPSLGLRIFNAYGARQSASSPYSGVIVRFCERLRRRETIVVHGDGLQSRDFIFGDDVAEAICLALGHVRAGADVMNICTGVETTVLSLADHIGKVLGVAPKLVFEEGRKGDVRRSRGDASHAAQTLGFVARTPLHVGLARTLEGQQAGEVQPISAFVA